MSIFKMTDLSHLVFYWSNNGFFEKLVRLSVETIALNCLVFEKISFFHLGDRQTDKQMDSPNALSRERRLDKPYIY